MAVSHARSRRSVSILPCGNMTEKGTGSTGGDEPHMRRAADHGAAAACIATARRMPRLTAGGRRTDLATLQKGGVPAAPSGTATLLRLSPNHRFRPRPTLAVTDFRRPRLSWLDGRCVQGPGTYSPIQLHGVGLQTPIRTEGHFRDWTELARGRRSVCPIVTRV